ncbi:GlxA family transcriptional regulator [Bifidobacterium leontopitheci]|uniref:AraC family transcriptional regulator n=1 Tax=Bifidobacterium leontopitheci TaxID=2650774 RepID=A0A6I1GP99_9BIFI|nr:helix-turn-helix domain-containing protein [Bifidobacterium leontopitheci]KAB7789888.1 AraC family transcriptional regulator [Bifidobacterium leontopitheci]
MRIAVLLPGTMWAFDVISIIQIFDDDSVERGGQSRPTIDFIAATASQPLDHGLAIAATPLADYHESPDLIIIPGFANPKDIAHDRRHGDDKAALFTDDPADALAIRDWLIERHHAGAEIAAMCTGVFALAWTGLLDGVDCTTHLPFVDDLALQFPKAVVMRDRLLTHDVRRRIWTSAGGSICLDLCLALMAEHEGQSLASAEADVLMMRYPHSTDSRRPRERQTASAVRSSSQQRDDIIALTCRVREHLSHDWTLDALARTVHMSPRSFQRRFVDVIGMPPSSWLLTERLNAAKELLELTDLPVHQVAMRAGLRNADLLRKHFTAAFGVSPSRYRRRFQEPALPR